MKFSLRAVEIALSQLAYFAAGASTWFNYGSTEDSPKRAAYYRRRGLKAMAKGLVEHDRILVDARYQ